MTRLWGFLCRQVRTWWNVCRTGLRWQVDIAAWLRADDEGRTYRGPR